tara:strand:+ start:1424 stop:1582 length:159 start_codon:yes stop_codon:yes gene_type:complete
MKIKITGNAVRHKKRIKELRLQLESTGAEVEVVYENTNYIKIENINTEDYEE